MLSKAANIWTKAKLPAPGFTLIELMVAVSILMVMVGLVAVNFNSFKVERNMKIAQNELITNLRKAQAYTLSARVVPGGQSGQFFILKFDGQNPAAYSLQAMYNIFATPTPPTLVTVEDYKLPDGVKFSSSSALTIYRDVFPATVAVPCGLVAYKAPFGKVYLNAGCNTTSPAFGSDDDYASLMNYVVNVAGADSHTSTDSSAVIKLTDDTGKREKKVLIRGVTGLICPTVDETNCSN